MPQIHEHQYVVAIESSKDGIIHRHSATIRAESAQDAITKALESAPEWMQKSNCAISCVKGSYYSPRLRSNLTDASTSSGGLTYDRYNNIFFDKRYAIKKGED